ncbi:MAG: DUF1295 domain-containing protein [Candidatus Eremiobacterota bacterium]
MEVLMLVAGGAAVVMGFMFVLWVTHMPLKNAAIVDVGWTFSLMLLAAYYAEQGPGWAPRNWLMAAMVAAWATRLGSHLFLTRVWKCPEEGRYQQLRRDWKTHLELKFLAFFLAQGVLDVVLSLPFLLVCLNPTPGLGPFEVTGMTLWLVAVVGEWLADFQLAMFKADPRNRGQVCELGLWNYSRHPNYFFESMVWVAWFLYALGSPFGWLAALSPALILFFLFRVTGIPATEAQALRSKGEAYRRYQETTSPFVPWFKRG